MMDGQCWNIPLSSDKKREARIGIDVVSGKASFRAGEETQAVAPGSLIFVERSVKHRFFDITEDLTVLVFFAPPEGSLEDGATK